MKADLRICYFIHCLEMNTKKASEDVIVRFARIDEMEFVVRKGYLEKEIVKRKIKSHEILIAEQRRQPAGYLRFEYLRSRVPYRTIEKISNYNKTIAANIIIMYFLKTQTKGS